jgi:hypothetical protein
MQRENRMEVTPQMKLDNLKARIASRDYVVDTDAVAEAIVRRLLFARPQPGLGSATAHGTSSLGTGPAVDAA